jgi:DNA primase
MRYASIEEAMINGYGTERSFVCHVHDDHTASASVNSLTGLWFCYACGARGKYDVSEIPTEKFAVALRKRLEALPEPRHYPENYLDVYDSMGPGDYWLGRFTAETCKRFRLGVSSDRRYATIPARDEDGHLLGVIRRDLTGTDEAKYRYPPGVNMSHLMWNFHRCRGDVLMLTEGATDAMAAVEAGFSDAAATYRNGLSKHQVELIVRYNPTVVLCAYDQDEAGDRGYGQMLNALYARRIKVDRLTWNDYKDLASIPLSDRAAMIEAVKKGYKLGVDNSGQPV